MIRTIQVFEYEKLTTRKDARGRSLSEQELAQLYEYNDRNRNIYFTAIRNGVKFSSYVGVIQIGGLTIEILPKTDRLINPQEEDYALWQKVLLQMLGHCNYIPLSTVSETNLRKRHNSLLDLYFSLFLDEVELLIRVGLIKKYLVVQKNTNSLKGQLLFPQNIKNNLIHKERFYTRHQRYNQDNIFNQIIYKALVILASVSNNTFISDRINRIRYDLPDITELNITAKHFERLQMSRKTIPYEKAIQIAKMIILNYSPDIKAGRENMIALLFDMNKLWEEYIYRMLKRASAARFKVSYQNSQKFWENKTIRPDIIVHDNSSGERFVLDAKWKIVDSSSPADGDLKQMFVYNIYYNTCKSLLVYPKAYEYREKFGKFHKGRDGDNLCKVSFVDVINNKGLLDINVGLQILGKLEI